MTLSSTEQKNPEIFPNKEPSQETEHQPILCQHCRRTASNGIKCRGICVADSDY